MKILFFFRSLALGGVERQVFPLAKRLERRGHQPSVAALFSRDPRWKWLLPPGEIPVSLLFHRSPENVGSALVQLILGTHRLRRLVLREQIDVVFAVPRAVSHCIAWAATRGAVRAQLVWGFRGSGGVRVARPDWTVALLTPLCRFVSSSVPLAIANSEATLNRLRTVGYRCRKSIAIENGIDVEVFRPDPAAGAELRAAWGCAKDDRLIGLVGRPTPIKGHRPFLEAIARLQSGLQHVRPVIVDAGQGTTRAGLERIATGLGLGERLVWVEATPDMAPVYSALDLLCSASSAEGFSNVIAEAMACELPCVVTDIGISAQIVDDLGVVVPPNDVAELAAGLEIALARLDSIDRRRLRERIAAHFGVDPLVDRTERALLEVVGTD